MKSWRIGILAVFAAAILSSVICHPNWLADNIFIDGIMSHEIISILIVVLTITFASVANIHLSISRILEQESCSEDAARQARREINSNAWIIFYAFIAAILVLVLKGSWPNVPHVVAFSHGIGLIVVLLNMLVLHDIYLSIFALSEASRKVSGRNENPASEHDLPA